MRSIVNVVLPLLCGTASRPIMGFVIQPLAPSSLSTSSQQRSSTTTTSSTTLFATWSDARAVQEYQQFLASGKSELVQESDGASVIIRPEDGSSTELADALFRMGMKDDVVLTPGQELPSELLGRTSFPIYITLPPGPLDQFLQSLPASYKDRYDDFVFFSGGLVYGNIEDMLKKYGYCRDSMTQVLISGVKIHPHRIEDLTVSLGISASGEEKSAGQCAACGKWLGAIAQRLEKNDVRCKVGSYREWRRLMWERSVYDAVFNLLGVVRSEPTTMAEVALYYSEEVSDMVWEISGLLRGWKALTLTYGFEERLFGIAEGTGKDQPCTLIDDVYPWIWGNTVYQEGKAFMEYLRFAQEEKGLLPSITLPPPATEERVTIMRQGNLRADGVI